MISNVLILKYLIAGGLVPWIVTIRKKYYLAASQNNPKSETYRDTNPVKISGLDLAKRLRRIFLGQVKIKIRKKEEDRIWALVSVRLRKSGLNRIFMSRCKIFYQALYSFIFTIRLTEKSKSSCSTYSTEHRSVIELTARARDQANIGSITSVLHEIGHAIDNHDDFSIKEHKNYWKIVFDLSHHVGLNVCFLLFFGMFVEKFEKTEILINFLSKPGLLYLQISTMALYSIALVSYFMKTKVTLEMEVSASKTAMEILTDNFDLLNVIERNQIASVKTMLRKLYLTYWNNLYDHKSEHLIILALLILSLPVQFSIPVLIVQFCLQKFFRPYLKLSRLTLDFEDYNLGPSIPLLTSWPR